MLRSPGARGRKGGAEESVKGERPTTATIDLQAIAANYAEAMRLGGGRDVIAVVKADGYGHGAVPVARRLVSSGCHHLAVVTVAEAAELRAAAIDCRILVLGGVHDSAEAADVLELGVTPVIQHAGHIGLLSQAAREHRAPLPVQAEVDTGMRRMGLAAEDAPALLERIAKEPALELEGVYTHLACADEEDLEPTLNQLRLFSEVLSAVQARGVDPRQVHVANSAGLLATADLAASLPPQVNAVRPGLMLYGAHPAAHLRERAALAPAMTLRSRVSNVRHVRPGDPVGYGGTFRARQRGRIATLPIGYADGVPWSLGNRGFVLLRGSRVPIAGRVSMDLVTVFVGEDPVEIGDPVVLFGEGLPVEEVAEKAGTISYELLVGIGGRVPRVVRA
jgi:alanine racemase